MGPLPAIAFSISVMFFVIFLHFLRFLFWYLRCLF
ncbi:preprotein translocase subunit Sec61beta [Mycobacterium tuberculosis]|nr:preprotein translocase subunit Sec61beta [Mycobacterium tuberculosis]